MEFEENIGLRCVPLHVDKMHYLVWLSKAGEPVGSLSVSW